MSVIDDSRILLQAIVSPDLKAIAAKLEAMTTSVHDRFEASEALNKQRYEALNQRFTDAEKLGLARYEALLQAIQSASAASNARIDSLVKNLSLDHRMELLEARFTSSQGATRDEQRP